MVFFCPFKAQISYITNKITMTLFLFLMIIIHLITLLIVKSQFHARYTFTRTLEVSVTSVPMQVPI